MKVMLAGHMDRELIIVTLIFQRISATHCQTWIQVGKLVGKVGKVEFLCFYVRLSGKVFWIGVLQFVFHLDTGSNELVSHICNRYFHVSELWMRSKFGCICDKCHKDRVIRRLFLF